MDREKAVVKHHKEVPYRLPEPIPELSHGNNSDSGNLIVQGDDLHALKPLLPRYAGQVKCIYIKSSGDTHLASYVNSPNKILPTIAA